MRRTAASSRLLVPSFLMSAALHAGAAVLIGNVGMSRAPTTDWMAMSSEPDPSLLPPIETVFVPPPPPVIPEPEPEPEPEPPLVPVPPPEVRLGNQNSVAPNSPTWIGYDVFEPHFASPSEVDQPELTRDPPPGPVMPQIVAPALAPSEPASPSEPSPPASPADPPRTAPSPADEPSLPREPAPRPPAESEEAPSSDRAARGSPDGILPPDAPMPAGVPQEPPEDAQTGEPRPKVERVPDAVEAIERREGAPAATTIAGPTSPQETREDVATGPEVVPPPPEGAEPGEQDVPASEPADIEAPLEPTEPGDVPTRERVIATARPEQALPPEPKLAPPAEPEVTRPRSQTDDAAETDVTDQPHNDAPDLASPNDQAPAEPVEPVPPVSPGKSGTAASSPSVPPSSPGVRGGGGRDAGEQSDRESTASSVLTATRAQLGKPIAGKGIEIKTVRPRFTHYTAIMTVPRSPRVRIHFRRDGEVEKVELVRSSGVADVDRPLLDAVYQWRAVGKELDALPPDTPGADPHVLVIEMRILL